MQRQAVEVMRLEAAVSERRACGLVKAHRATCRYRRRRVPAKKLGTAIVGWSLHAAESPPQLRHEFFASFCSSTIHPASVDSVSKSALPSPRTV